MINILSTNNDILVYFGQIIRAFSELMSIVYLSGTISVMIRYRSDTDMPALGCVRDVGLGLV